MKFLFFHKKLRAFGDLALDHVLTGEFNSFMIRLHLDHPQIDQKLMNPHLGREKKYSPVNTWSKVQIPEGP